MRTETLIQLKWVYDFNTAYVSNELYPMSSVCRLANDQDRAASNLLSTQGLLLYMILFFFIPSIRRLPTS